MTDSVWNVSSPSAERVDWVPVWRSHNRENLRIEHTRRSGNRGDYSVHRVVHGQMIGAGAVAVAVHRDQERAQVLLVHQVRIRPGVELWELPRGVADEEDPDLVNTALREMREETGVLGDSGRLLGHIYPDSGLLAAAVGVVLVHVSDPGEPHPADGEALAAAWFGVDRLGELVASGQLRDGISLSALLLAGVWADISLRL